MAKDIDIPDPTVVFGLLVAFRRSKTMFAAVSLGVFDSLAEGAKTAVELASVSETSALALERLLDACVGLKLLLKQDGVYSNSPEAATYLVASSPHRLSGYIACSNDVLWTLWSHLEDAVREGSHRWKQSFGWDGPIFSSFFHTEAWSCPR
jgi:acetylserotonin O-methyltransferase